MNQTIVFTVVVGVLGGLVWAGSPLNSSTANTDEVLQGIDVGQVEQRAHQNTARSFDDHYQRYVGVLDVLREYPAP